ncbi:MAG: hypothetical protein NTV56_20745 [Alphaproteobacteria bacterium]|nr:hypothetical protein [Alphaproteobacteria bacterium]
MVGNIILKFVAAGAVLGLAFVSPVAAAPLNDECVDCTPAPSRYDTEEVIKKIQSANRLQESQDQAAPAEQPVAEEKRPRRARSTDCTDCPPPRKYDDRKVVKKVRNVDHSRVINTVTVVPAGRRVTETNRLVIEEDETRNTGVVQHNHTIVEKETRYVHRVPIVTTVNFVTRQYRVVEMPDTVSVPVTTPVSRCRDRWHGRHGSCGPLLRVRG